MHRRTFEEKEKMLRSKHPHTLINVNNPRSILKNKYKDEDAEAIHRQALIDYEQILGSERPDTLNVFAVGLQLLTSPGTFEWVTLLRCVGPSTILVVWSQQCLADKLACS